MERYLRALPEIHHATMLAPRAPGWTSEEEAAVHYMACNDMNLEGQIGHHALLRASAPLFCKTAHARTIYTADREHRTLLSWT